MATIKVKFRPSAVNGKAGAVCYQLCHRQENKQITTSMRIFPHWWNPQKRELITTPDNAATVSAYRRQIEQDVHKLREIVRQLDAAAQPYTLTDVVRLFQSDLVSNGILEYLQKEILRLQDNNQYGTSRNYRRTLSSFSTFLKGTDVPLPAVDATLIGRYDTSRHSWATAARNHDIPLSVISAGMGHTSEKTTRIYLDSLNNTIIDDANRGILRDFNLTVSM